MGYYDDWVEPNGNLKTRGFWRTSKGKRRAVGAMAQTMSLDEFRKIGYLQEVNRRYLHPMGLVLAVRVEDDGRDSVEVMDYRGEPGGVVFAEEIAESDEFASRAHALRREWNRRLIQRDESLGYGIQPVPGDRERKITVDLQGG